MRQRWFGASGRRVPEIAVEGEEVAAGDDHVRVGEQEWPALVVTAPLDAEALGEAHERGCPVVVRARTAEEVKTALARPEVASVLVPPDSRELLDLDLVELTYG